MGIVAAIVFVGSFFQNWLLLATSANVTAKMRTTYLEKVLGQESAWYDQTTYMEVASRLGKECDII